MKFSRFLARAVLSAALIASAGAFAQGDMPAAFPVPFIDATAAAKQVAVPAATQEHAVDQYPDDACANPPAKFDGKLLYKCTFQQIMKHAYRLEDAATRESWAAKWEHKHDKDKALSKESGADKAVRAMLDGLGERFNYYYDRAATRAADTSSTGSFGGIGVDLMLGGKLGTSTISNLSPLTVGGVHDDSAAKEAGVQAKDVISKIDGESLDGQTLSEAIDKLRGDVGAGMTLTILRDGKEIAIPIVRRKIVIPFVVDGKFVTDDVYYFRIKEFEGEFEDQVSRQLTAGKNAKAFVIDLRHNPGGMLNDANWMSQALMTEGKYLVIRERDGTKISTTETILEPDYMLEKDGDKFEQSEREPALVAADQVLIVLVDEWSASCSEIIAGALQKSHRAIIVGKPTVGKGVGQRVITLPFGRSAHIISFAFQPGGEDIDWVGVIPDVTVDGNFDNPGDSAKDQQLKAAIEQAQKQIVRQAEIAKTKAERRKQHEDEFKKSLEEQIPVKKKHKP